AVAARIWQPKDPARDNGKGNGADQVGADDTPQKDQNRHPMVRRWRGISSPRMVLGMQLFQALSRNVRIDLRGRDVCVPKQQLHHPEIGAMVQKVRRKRMAQGVRRDSATNTSLNCVALDQVPKRLTGHRLRTRCDEQLVALLASKQLRSRLL